MSLKELCKARNELCAKYDDCFECELGKLHSCRDIISMYESGQLDIFENAIGICENNESEKTYENGFKDAWELAKRVCLCPSEYKDALGNHVLQEIFQSADISKIMNEYDPSVVLYKVCEYEKNKVQLYDVVTAPGIREEVVVTHIAKSPDKDIVHLLCIGSGETRIVCLKDINRTGRNAYALKEVLETL